MQQPIRLFVLLVIAMLSGVLAEDALARARMYNPQAGRFMQRDPLGYADGMNTYEYVKSNPIVQNDPHGKNVWDAIKKARGGSVPKAAAVDVQLSMTVGNGLTMGMQLIFFPDTCELGLFGILPAAANPNINIGTGFPGLGQYLLNTNIGLDTSLTFNGSIARYRGSGAASAATWSGIFRGGDINLGPVNGFVFWDPNLNWIGAGAGAGPSFGIAKTNMQHYVEIASDTLQNLVGNTAGTCLCYALVTALP